MAFQFSLTFLALIGAAVYVAYRVLAHLLTPDPFWNIPGPAPENWVNGNLKQLFSRHSWEWHKSVTDIYGPTTRWKGPFGQHWLQTADPRALHSILLRDQDAFSKSLVTQGTLTMLIGPGVLSIEGKPHRKQRKMLNPVFSGAHMRGMTPIFYDIAHKLKEGIAARLQDGPAEVDVLGWMGRTALELVGQGTFGYSFDPLVRDETDEYGEAVKMFFPTVAQLPAVRFLLPYVQDLAPAFVRRAVLDRVPNAMVQRAKVISDTMDVRSKEIFEGKKRALKGGDVALLEQVGEAKDLMSVLLKANMMADEKDKLPDEELVSQMSTFALAGMDTTSNALSRILQILSQKPEYQEKLRDEIMTARNLHGGEIPYDEIMALPFLDSICRETLRLHAPVRVSTRESTKDTVLPLSTPIHTVDGKVLSELHVPKGTTVVLNLIASNRNKQLWGEDADEWKPERWAGDLPRDLLDAPIPGIYAHLMTFLGGAHACIGFKFSQLEMKVVLAVLLSNFKFETTDKPIVWNFAAVEYPTVGKESARPEMPLKLSLLSS